MSSIVLKWLKLKREVSPFTTLLSGNLGPGWIDIQSTSYGKQENLSLLHKFIFPFWFSECKPRSFPGLRNGTWTFSSLRYGARKLFRLTEWKLKVFWFTE